jgi:divalent metal cation (Fe/Co/Zn/Cd) transporter
VAEKTGSSALATDAFHFASDIWSSMAVLAGLGASWLGAHYGVGVLRYADPLAAVVVSLLILRLTLKLGREAVSVLLDEIPAETRQRLIAKWTQVPGVLAWSRRGCGGPERTILPI